MKNMWTDKTVNHLIKTDGQVDRQTDGETDRPRQTNIERETLQDAECKINIKFETR